MEWIMNKKDDESWLNLLIPIVLIAIAVYWLFDYNPKSERYLEVMNEINSSKVH